mmetsp:Transcript_13767/g.21554  ORF Transcript_13767/g.21554 Transcript_13767/m.21554 type:complete len:313 (+) Transcript_13767:46-984(+)
MIIQWFKDNYDVANGKHCCNATTAPGPGPPPRDSRRCSVRPARGPLDRLQHLRLPLGPQPELQGLPHPAPVSVEHLWQVQRHQHALHGLVELELDADHGHHRGQPRGQRGVERAQTFLAEDAREAVDHVPVGDEVGRGRRLGHDPRLHRVEGDHEAHGGPGRERAQPEVLRVRRLPPHQSAVPVLGPLVEHPGEPVGGDLLRQRREPPVVKPPQALRPGDAGHGSAEVRVPAGHQPVRDHHLRRRHHRADGGGDGGGHEIEQRPGRPARVRHQVRQCLLGLLHHGEGDGPVRHRQQELRPGPSGQELETHLF